MILNEIKIKPLFKANIVRIFEGAKYKTARIVKMSNSLIYVHPNATLLIGENCVIENAYIFVEKGSLSIGDFSIIKGSKKSKISIIINDGEVSIANHSKVMSRRIWVRFGGNLSIGEYTNINKDSEIRCDEKITIGSYNQISYNVKIWDTNTHNILEPSERRNIAETKYPYFGFESSRPNTSPVVIGNDCWLGENSAIFKGSMIGDECIVGYGTMIAGKTIPPKTRVINKRALRIDPL